MNYVDHYIGRIEEENRKLKLKIARLEYEAQDDPRKTGEWDAMEKRCRDLEEQVDKYRRAPSFRQLGRWF